MVVGIRRGADERGRFDVRGSGRWVGLMNRATNGSGSDGAKVWHPE